MGRSPCCEKVGLKKGPWTPEEDQKLLAFIEQHGHGSWRALPAKAGLQRCGKSCRLRWINYLRPDIKRGKFSLQEEQTIIQLHALLGNRWSAIAAHLPKRTDNEIKNYWNTHLKKRLTKMGIDPVTHKPKTNPLGQPKDTANLSHMAQWESARLEAEARLVRESKLVSKPPPANHPHDHQLGLGSSKAVAPAGRPQCLDVLKAWQGVVSGMFGAACRDNNLESPTSTLNFNEHVLLSGPPAVGLFSDNLVGNSIPCFEKSGQIIEGTKDNLDNSSMPIGLHEMTYATDGSVATWFQDSFRTAENIMEGLSSDLMICDSVDNDPNSSIIINAAESSTGNVGGNFDQENKNFWNGLMNLASASMTWSPVF
ncbi:hypothetical protein WN944_020531 [Citrus x changshan-huyou]|uniref:Uncharacterized protein n=1 Tax=Citrus x changshan-huyou TaxID=2935761 RepID=A0AAP0QG66_9ROSI